MLISTEHSFSKPSGFIAIDGVNGAGKGTYIKKLEQYLKKTFDISPIISREPGGTPLGNELRPLILGKQFQGQFTELFLFSADRNEHVCSKIIPALKNNHFVITDRYYYSTTAFQGYGRKIPLPLDQINAINQLAINNCYPDLWILLDIDPALGLERTKKRQSSEYDKMEDEEISFHNRIRSGFLETAETCQEPCFKVDASNSPEDIWQATKPLIDKLIIQWKTQIKKQ